MKLSALSISKLKSVVLVSVAILMAPFSNSLHATTSSGIVEYFGVGDPSYTGIGFIADGKSLYVGGCQVFDLVSRTRLSGCRYPTYTRWASVSPDGTLILSTSIDPKSNSSMSFQSNALTGKILSSKPGLHFVPPIAIHPSNKFWVSVRAGKTDTASETAVVIDKNWQVIKDNLYGQTRRIFALEFTSDGRKLLVNGGGPDDGVTLQTSTWQPTNQEKRTMSVQGILQQSPDERWGVKVEGVTLDLVDIKTGAIITSIDIDVTDGEPQVAFSQDSQLLAAKGYINVSGHRQYGFALVTLPKR